MSAETATLAETATPMHAVELPTGGRQDRERFRLAGVGLISPAALLLLVLFMLPVGLAFYYGLTNLKLIGAGSNHTIFQPHKNFSRATNDAVLHKSIELTLIFVIVGVIASDIVGMALASLIRVGSALVGGFVGALALIAFMLPPITVGVTWYAFSGAGGTLSTVLHQSHADYLVNDAMTVLIAANVWSLAGFAMLTYAAALRAVPQDMIEAARLENTSGVQRALHLFLPALKPSIVVTSLIMTLLSLGNFTLVYLLTAGGPGNSTDILPMYSYQQGLQFSDLGYGALIGDITVVIAAVVAVFFVRASRVPQ